MGDNLLYVCFRALEPWLRKQRGPVRWKPRMIVPPQLRAVRTTLLGHMPGWCPPVHAVGPWRPVELLDPASADILHGVRADLWARLQDQDGVVSVRMHFPASRPRLARSRSATMRDAAIVARCPALTGTRLRAPCASSARGYGGRTRMASRISIVSMRSSKRALSIAAGSAFAACPWTARATPGLRTAHQRREAVLPRRLHFQHGSARAGRHRRSFQTLA